MKAVRILMLDLKSYYNSPAYQLGLIVSYACTESIVEDNVEFIFTEHPRTEPASQIVSTIMEANPDMVTMSNYAWNYKKICAILNILEKLDQPIPKILIGGPNSAGSFGAEMMTTYPIISAMVEGEGEPAFKDICISLVSNPDQNPFTHARNCLTRNDKGEVIRPTTLHRIQSLDEVPSPYLSGIIPLHPAPLFYETNRGCPYRCTFCYWGNGNSKVYRMSHERITEEIEFFAKNKVRAMFLADANFGIFPDDSNIAELIVEANAKYGYPIRFVGVNWAKNSSERILEIASIFRKGKIGVATTLAIQSVSEQAEEISKRYAMPPSRFINLTKSADERNIDTYTDMIWGLPGETYPEFLHGLHAVISTGVPSLLIHQLSLLPGTQLYESKEKLKIKLLSEEKPNIVIPQEDRSDYLEYIVVSHQNMSYEDMKKGARILGIAHILHNHDLAKIVNFYLAKYDFSLKDAFLFMDQLLLEEIDYFPQKHNKLLNNFRETIIGFAEGTGNDETIFYRQLSEQIWFIPSDDGMRLPRENEMQIFMHDFYKAFLKNHNLTLSPKENSWLQEIIDYNWLVSPKPTWRPDQSYEFRLDVHQIWHDIKSTLYTHAAIDNKKKKSPTDNWEILPVKVMQDLKTLLTDDYLISMERMKTFQVKNPWIFPPSKTNIDWLLTANSKHCIISEQFQGSEKS